MVGTWTFDGEKTLIELRKRDNVPENVLGCYEKSFCGGSSFTYKENYWLTVDGEQIPYDIIKMEGNSYLVKTSPAGEVGDFVVVFLNPNTAYIELEIDGFRYNDYIRRSQ